MLIYCPDGGADLPRANPASRPTRVGMATSVRVASPRWPESLQEQGVGNFWDDPPSEGAELLGIHMSLLALQETLPDLHEHAESLRTASGPAPQKWASCTSCCGGTIDIFWNS